jgi:hypothetical protein
MTKKERDLLKKQQEKLEHALEMLEIDQQQFMTMLREDRKQV